MGALRTALALGALTLSVPAFAQGSRSAVERSRADRGRVERRSESRPDDRNANRNDGRNNLPNRPPVDNRGNNSGGNRSVNPGDSRPNRAERRDEPRNESRARPDDRGNRGDVRLDRRDSRYDRPDNRYDRRDSRYDGRVIYRYDARDFRRYDVPTISIWFRSRGMMRAPAYGLRDRYDFRPGIYLSTIILARLDVLPFDLELELGALPWYLERRIYGRTVLIIDTRTRLLVDMYDIDW